MTRPLPEIGDAEFAEHWAGLKAGEIRVPRCDECGRPSWPPRPVCPSCGSLEHTWTTIGAEGTVYSWTVVGHCTMHGFDVPYPVVLVELAGTGGLRLLGGFTDEIAELAIGLPVTARFQQVSDEVTLLEWTPRSPEPSTEGPTDSAREAPTG